MIEKTIMPCSFCGKDATAYGAICGRKLLCEACNLLKRAPVFATTTARLNTAVSTPDDLPRALEPWSAERFEILQHSDPLFGNRTHVVVLWRCTVLEVPR